LGGEGFVGRQDEGRPLDGFDHVCHGKGLARSGDPQQHVDGMYQGVRIGMAEQATAPGDVDAAEHERAPFDQAMKVKADAGSHERKP
jgi:hypothetical protein